MLIIDQESIPNRIYRTDNCIIKVLLQNHSARSVEVTDKVHYNKIYEIRSININHSQIDKTWQRLQEILKSSNVDHLEPEQRQFIRKLIAKYEEVFSLDTEPLPCTSLTEHEIVLKTGKIVNLRSHKLPEKHGEFSLQEIEKLLRKGIVKESQPSFKSPLWIVPKKDNKFRMVIDYRKINEDTDQDAYPLPVIDVILDQLGKAKFLSAGFHQIPMKESDKKYTAFSTSQGYFEYNGFKNASATFQRMMNNAFRGLIGTKCFAYVDDIVIFGNTLQQYNEYLEAVLERIKQLGLRLEPKKCEYLKPELKYLGDIITKDGVKPNPEKINTVKNVKQLKTVKDVQSFLGLAGYYRKFIKNLSSIARPLNRLTHQEIIFDWTTDCEKAFYDLKHALIFAPVLRFPNFNEQFTSTTDASNQGLGTVLSQNNHA